MTSEGDRLSRPTLVGCRPALVCRRGPTAVTAVLVPDRPAVAPRGTVPPSAAQQAAAFRPVTVRLPGTAVAVGRIGRSLVVLHRQDDRVAVRVLGRRAPFMDGFDVPATDVGLGPEDDPDGPLGSVTLDHSGLLVGLGASWVRFRRDADGCYRPATWREEGPVVAAVPGPDPDVSTVASEGSWGGLSVAGPPRYRYLRREDLTPADPTGPGLRPRRYLLGADAVAVGARSAWNVADLLAAPVPSPELVAHLVRVPPEEEVLGLVRTAADDLRLLTRSGVGLLLRGRAGVTPAVHLPGPFDQVSVHPRLPLVATVADDGGVVVRDVVTGLVVQRLTGEGAG